MGGCCAPRDTAKIFDAKRARDDADRYRREGLGSAQRRIVDYVVRSGVAGRTVLEVGGGVGDMQIELVRAGAARATNVELSPAYEEAAAELVRDVSLSDQIERRVMDFAEAGDDVPAAEVVILHRVVCCYPHLSRLVGAAADRARWLLLLTFPNGSWLARLGGHGINLGMRLRRVDFRFYVHAPDAIFAVAREHGLRAAASQRGIFWQFAALERERR